MLTETIIKSKKQLTESTFSWNNRPAITWWSYNGGDQHIKQLVLSSFTFKTCQNHEAVLCGSAQTVIKCLPTSLASLFTQSSLTREDLTGISHVVFTSSLMPVRVIMLSLVHLGVLLQYFFFFLQTEIWQNWVLTQRSKLLFFAFDFLYLKCLKRKSTYFLLYF